MKNTESIKAQLRKLATNANKPYEYLQTHYFIERLLFRLSHSEYADAFVLKGGLLLYSIFSHQSRATRDMDFLARNQPNDPAQFARILSVVCQIDSDDGVRFDTESITAVRIKEDADYQGIRLKVDAYLDRSRSVLQLDIGFGDIVVPAPQVMTYPSLLDMDEVRLLAYSKESVIAEKFQAMLFLAQINSRMKDFFDITTLSNMFDFDGKSLRDAIEKTLINRKTPLVDEPIVFSPSFRIDIQKTQQWDQFLKRTSLDALPFAETMGSLTVFLEPLYQAIQSGAAFTRTWLHEKRAWTE